MKLMQKSLGLLRLCTS